MERSLAIDTIISGLYSGVAIGKHVPPKPPAIRPGQINGAHKGAHLTLQNNVKCRAVSLQQLIAYYIDNNRCSLCISGQCGPGVLNY